MAPSQAESVSGSHIFFRKNAKIAKEFQKPFLCVLGVLARSNPFWLQRYASSRLNPARPCIRHVKNPAHCLILLRLRNLFPLQRPESGFIP
jgi:hypothetical protein